MGDLEGRGVPMTWKNHKDPRELAPGVEVQALRSGHTHEGAHDVTVNGKTLRVLPDPHTTARQRSDTLRRAVDDLESGTVDTIGLMIGYLVAAGATHLELDGQPLVGPTGDQLIGQIDVDVYGDRLEMRFKRTDP